MSQNKTLFFIDLFLTLLYPIIKEYTMFFPRLAIDNQISKEVVSRLFQKYQIIVVAENYPDKEWLDYAIKEDANIFISPDYDIPNYLDYKDHRGFWIQIPQGLKSDNQYKFINKRIKAYIKTKKQYNKSLNNSF